MLIDGKEELLVGEDRLSSVGGVGNVVAVVEVTGFKCAWARLFISCDRTCTCPEAASEYN